MELVERYVQAVAGYLPGTQSGDIIAELKDSLLSKLEDREAELGRPMTVDEQGALLKQHGHPMLVASRYLPQQQLIGPTVYPYWRFGAQVIVTVLAIIYGILAVIAIANQADSVQSLVLSAIQTLTQAAFEFATTALVYLGVLTAVFALLDRHQVRISLFDNWQPTSLAPVHDRLKIKSRDSLLTLIFGVLFLCWWSGLVQFPSAVMHEGAHRTFTLSNVWQTWWLTILSLVVFDVLLAAGNLMQPRWTRGKLLLRLVLNSISLGVLWQLFQADQLLTYAVQAGDTPAPEQLLRLVNQVVRWVLAAIALICAAEMVQDIRRMLLLR